MKEYSVKPYHQILVQYFDELPLWSAPFGLKLLDTIEYKPGTTALDIGFGTGFPLIELAMRLGDQSTIYGIDPWKEAIQRTQEKIAYHQVPNIRIIEGVAETIPLPDRSIDLIVSNNGINNVRDIDKVLSECARIAKPGAQFVLTVNLNKSMFEFYDTLEAVLNELELKEIVNAMHAHIYDRRKPLSEMITHITGHGFMIRHVAHDEFRYRFADGTAMFNHGFVMRAFLPAWTGILPQDRADEIINIVEERLNAQARISGGMDLSIPFVAINAYRNQ